MKTLVILSQKGGTGKTTMAVHLAVEASRSGKTVALIDLDPQASAAKWGDTRSDDTPIVISAHATRLPQVLHTAEQGGVDLAIIDTSPNTDPNTLNAVKVANLMLIPSRDARFDLEAIGSTIQIGKMADVPMRVVFNAVKTRSSMFYKAKRAVEVYVCRPLHMCLVTVWRIPTRSLTAKLHKSLNPTAKHPTRCAPFIDTSSTNWRTKRWDNHKPI